MRLFVAAEVPAALKDAIERDVVEPLRETVPGVRWTHPEGRHLTIKFIGNVDDGALEPIATAVASAAARHAPFTAAFSEVGGFPTLGRPRVLWVGLGRGAAELAGLAHDLEAVLEPLGIEREARGFRAHYTLARIPRPRALGEVPEVVVPGAPFPVTEIVLYRSQLHPRGARYTALERLPLAG